MNVVGYVRLSRDEDHENYTSIETQQDILKEYARKMNWTISKMYIDDNYSGYTFKRPAFKEMRNDISQGMIDIILAKDLSRIGRHSARMQLFIEEEIQDLNIRLICPEEPGGFDSQDDDDGYLGIKTWYNERYVKDISKKIKSSMHSKQRKGELVMGNQYGYLKDPKNKSNLHIDKNIKPIIELIFKLYIGGMGYKKICDVLNENGYMTPSQYIKQQHAESERVFKNAVSEKWQTHNIQRIIQNDLYIGTLRTHKMQNRKLKGKQDKVALEEQYVFENHHDPLINREDFFLAQQIRSKRKASNYRGSAKYNYLFSSFIFCGECRFAATGRNISRKPKVQRGYECTQYTKYGLDRCVIHSIPEEKLVFFFKEFLKDVKDTYQDYLMSLDIQENKVSMDNTLDHYKKNLSHLNDAFKLLLNQKIKDLNKEQNPEYKEIIEETYIKLENDKKKMINELSHKIAELQIVNDKDEKRNFMNAVDLFNKIIESETPDRKMLELVIDKIYIYHDKSIEFKLLIDIVKLVYGE